MTPLLEALRDAAKVGFDAPKCGRCNGSAVATVCACQKVHDCGCRPDECEPPARTEPCQKCHATGLDASDPERLIARAMAWLRTRKPCPVLDVYDRATHYTQILGNGTVKATFTEHHDPTPAGLATALLRLVARVGAKEIP